MLGTVELAMFAIQAGVKLARAGRIALVEDTAQRALTLPLPATFVSLEAEAMRFVGALASNDPRLNDYESTLEVLDRSSASVEEKVQARQEMAQLYLLDIAVGNVETISVRTPELIGVLAVRQWEEGGEPFPSPVQRVAGALVEIAVDYFVQMPGAINADSKHGKTLKAFLTGLDDVSFQDARWDVLAITLFTTGLDAVKDDPRLFVSDERGQLILESIMGGVADDLNERLAKIPSTGDLDAEVRLAEAGQVVLRSILRTSGSVVLNNPEVLGIDHDGRAAVVQSVGGAFLDLLLEDTGDAGEFTLSQAVWRSFSTDGMDSVIHRFLGAAVEHPDFFGIGDRDVQGWVQNVLRGLHDGHPDAKTFFDPSLFTEVAFLVVDHGLRDLPALLDFDGDEKQAILVEAARQVFDAISDPPAGGAPASWKFNLSRQDVLGVFSGVLASVADNPQWLFERADNQEAAAERLRFGVDSLVALGEGRFKALLRSGRLADTVAAVLTSGIIDKIEDLPEKQVATAIIKTIDAVMADGVAGLSQLVDDGALGDLLTAVADSGVADDLFSGTPAKKKAAREAVARLVQVLRTGPRITITEMSASLSVAA